LSNTFKAIALLRVYEVKTMYDVDDLIEEVKMSPTKASYNRRISLTSETIDDHKLTVKLFEYIQSSDTEDVEKIKDLIISHPRRYVISQSNPESFTNKLYKDTRPIYEAARFGYIETVKLLLLYGADPHLKCGTDFLESSLDVACR
jgi:hypothetical protein